MTDDNIPAFPQYVPTGVATIDEQGNLKREFQLIGGLTTRQWFAGMALLGIHASLSNIDTWPNDEQIKTIAEIALKQADAMMKARGE